MWCSLILYVELPINLITLQQNCYLHWALITYTYTALTEAVGEFKNIVACRPVARQRQRNKQPYNKRCEVMTATDTHATVEEVLEAVFSVPSGSRLYNEGQLSESWDGSWKSNELIVGQSPRGKNVSKEAEIIGGIRYQATTREDTANWQYLARAIMNCRGC
jgi:hypothetical protein